MRNTASTRLKNPKLCMSMNKYNLFNLTQVRSPTTRYKTQNFFKQKWVAKSELRRYHGEHIRERQWQKMFSKRLASVVPMNARYLAVNDGTVESAGRGSGLQQQEVTQDRRRRIDARPRTPFMLQTFAPLERRLDIAIYRALFASSARQARQFVIHGNVTVNGKPMRYPGYLLNPGDLFQVEPERVLFAMGAPKAILDDSAQRDSEDLEAEAAVSDAAEAELKDRAEAEAEDADLDRTPKEILKSLLAQSKHILNTSKHQSVGAKKKQALRAFNKGVRKLMSKSGREDVDTTSVTSQLAALEQQIRLTRAEKSNDGVPQRAQTPDSGAESTATAAQPIKDVEVEEDAFFSRADTNDLRRALEVAAYNPIDESKPYATPWSPRDYLPAFAFIPRYLEVNQNICAAVYLRHPVARPGLSEVPSPFPEAASANAFAWYLRRR